MIRYLNKGDLSVTFIFYVRRKVYNQDIYAIGQSLWFTAKFFADYMSKSERIMLW